MAAFDLGPVSPPTLIPKKGDVPVAPAFLTVLGAEPPTINPLPNSTGRRTALARWLTLPDNPFTARVLVNRVWLHHFGPGLVNTPADFGAMDVTPHIKEGDTTVFIVPSWSNESSSIYFWMIRQ